jgi:hypothetical protein
LDNLSFYQPTSLTRVQVRIAKALHLTLFAASGRSHTIGNGVGVTEPEPAWGWPLDTSP